MGERQPLVEKTIPDSGWREYVQWLLRRRRRFRVRENSMVPTLMPGDTVLAEMGGAIKVGDIAIVRWDSDARLSGVSEQRASQVSAPPLVLVKRVSEIFYDGGVYLISDNAHEPSARDSRHFGVIEANCILGRVTSRLASSL